MISQSHIIFDLDGTLIDSASSILGAFKEALENLGYEPLRPLSSDLIGPPLKDALQLISGESSPEKLSKLIDEFKSIYDEKTCTLSSSYPGAGEMLRGLSNAGRSLHVATNKRLIPTKKIIHFMGWEKHFKSIYSIDGGVPAYPNKSRMIDGLIADLGLSIKDCIYIGDQLEDGEAAVKNSISFIYANWGYGPDFRGFKNCLVARSINDLWHILNNFHEN